MMPKHSKPEESPRPRKGLEDYVSLLDSPKYKDRVTAIRGLGNLNDRRAYPILMDFLEDNELNRNLAAHTIGALAHLRDSRALFPLVNYFHRSSFPLIWQRVLQYTYYTKDPRAREFLEDYIQQKKKHPFLEIAVNALEASKDNANFLYRFNGSEEDYDYAKLQESQIKVSNAALTQAAPIIAQYEEENYKRPQTYVIKEDEAVLIGGHLQEHVQVARGEDVLAAGEITFSRTGEQWKVETVNYRSCGYFPGKTCFKWVQQFFNRSDVLFEKTQFDEDFPREGYNDPDFLSLFKL